jgi:hypothetical protein
MEDSRVPEKLAYQRAFLISSEQEKVGLARARKEKEDLARVAKVR